MAYEATILAAMKEELRCPICATVEDREFEILADLQNEVIGTEATRRAIAREGGFCDYHFRMFAKMATADTNALLLLALADEHCSQTPPAYVSCRVCVELSRYEKAIQSAVVELLPTSSFRESYAGSIGLCLPHRRIVGLDPRIAEINPWLDDMQRKQIQSILPMLRELSTSPFFATTRSQREAIPRMVEKFAGRKAVGS